MPIDDVQDATVLWLQTFSRSSMLLTPTALKDHHSLTHARRIHVWGDTINTEQANYDGTVSYNQGEKGENRGQTLEVGQFKPNAFGLYDVHGNVLE